TARPTTRPTTPDCTRRGFRQQPRRRLEHELRGRIVTLSEVLDEQGYTLEQRSQLLHMFPRTLRQWHYDFRAERTALLQPLPLPLLGRRVVRASVPQRNAVIELLNE